MAKANKYGKNKAVALDNKIKGLEIELKYASMKKSEYGSVKYGGTKATRERFYQWSDEVRRLQKELTIVQQERAKIKIRKKKTEKE